MLHLIDEELSLGNRTARLCPDVCKVPVLLRSQWVLKTLAFCYEDPESAMSRL